MFYANGSAIVGNAKEKVATLRVEESRDGLQRRMCDMSIVLAVFLRGSSAGLT